MLINVDLHFYVCVCVCVRSALLVHVGGNELICQCILTMFACAADAALMRSTFQLVLLPHAVAAPRGGGIQIDTNRHMLKLDISTFVNHIQILL